MGRWNWESDADDKTLDLVDTYFADAKNPTKKEIQKLLQKEFDDTDIATGIGLVIYILKLKNGAHATDISKKFLNETLNSIIDERIDLMRNPSIGAYEEMSDKAKLERHNILKEEEARVIHAFAQLK